MMEANQKPEWQPKGRCQNHIAVVEKQEDLEDRWSEPLSLTIFQVTAEVAHEILVETMIGVLWLDPDSEH
jgi:hypothetical protein